MAEPVSIEQLRDQVRLGADDSQDDLLTAYGLTAREMVEEMTGFILVRRAFTEVRTRFSDLWIYKRPLVSLTSVAYKDGDGEDQAYVGGLLRLDRYPAQIVTPVGGSFPSSWTDGTISITYQAGYADGEVPQVFCQAIRMLVAHWFNHREGTSDQDIREVPMSVKALLRTQAPIV
jgi:uncharacterized phiE125 gp8 family phage protein